MDSFQIGLLFSLPVHTYLLTCETGYWSIFIYVHMKGCVKCHVYFSTFVFANESWFFVCRVLSFIFYWFGMVRRKLTIPERCQAVGMHNDGFSHRRVADHFRVNHSIIVRLMQRFRQTIQDYVLNFVSDLRQDWWFFFQFPPSIKLSATILLKMALNTINPSPCYSMLTYKCFICSGCFVFIRMNL